MLHLGLSENDLKLLIRDLESHQLYYFVYVCIIHVRNPCVYGFVEVGFTCPQGSSLVPRPFFATWEKIGLVNGTFRYRSP